MGAGSIVGTPDSDSANIAALTGVSFPAGVQSGDVALLAWAMQNTQTFVDPTSHAFSLVGTKDHATSSCRLRVLKRICTGTESSATISGWNNGAINRQTACLVVYRGYVDIDGIVFLDESVAGTSHDCPSIGTGNGAVDGDHIIVVAADRAATLAANGDPPTTPVPFTERITGGSGGTSGTYVNVSDDGLQSGRIMPFDPGSFTNMLSTANAITATIAFRPIPFAAFGIPL